MRYADGPAVEVETYIEASPDVVWNLVTDIDLPARYSSEYRGGRWIDEDTPRLGARFVGDNQHDARGNWSTTSHVVRFEPPLASSQATFGWAVTDPDNPSATWEFRLESSGTGTTLVFRGRMGPGPSGLSSVIEAHPDKEERIVARRLEEWKVNMEATVTGIKDVAESAG